MEVLRVLGWMADEVGRVEEGLGSKVWAQEGHLRGPGGWLGGSLKDLPQAGQEVEVAIRAPK